MKELTPEIIEILEQFTDPKEREEILQAFEDGWYDEGKDRPSADYIAREKRLEKAIADIFNPDVLCSECEELGYCKYDRQEAIQEEREAVFLRDDEICNLVPIHFDDEYWRHTGNYSKKHLKAAFEAFHQQDYQTSILNAQAVIDENKTLAAPYLVIAVCQYFLGDYAEAINHYDIYLGNIQYIPQDSRDKMHYFIWHCENKLNSFIGQ